MSERYLISPCCQAAIDLFEIRSDSARCPACSKTYELREDIDFAEFSSGSMEHFKWSMDQTYIVKYYFHNMTLEHLEGIAENIKILSLAERRPHKLLPIFKAMHDCLKKRLQQHLVLDRVPNLSVEQKARIAVDLPKPGNNLLKLADHLCEAYPQQAAKVELFKNNDKLKMLLWLRNKEEHIAVASWPMRSYVHTDNAKLPSECAEHVAELTIPLAVDILHFCLDFLKLIYDLDPKDVREWHYEVLNNFRIHCTV